ncbi:MAG: DUF1934 domain-containing protein, partial [Clostridium sp.]|nr:DUF1934 domain-containing protein [Clostridium sp.]
MDKKALISITSNAGVEGDEVIEVISPGKYIRFDDGFKAVYEETEISGMDGTTTTLTIKDREVVLEREGTTNTKMYFNEKEPSISMYQTPYGMLEISIDTKELKIDMDEDGGELVIGYSLAVAGQAPLDTK